MIAQEDEGIMVLMKTNYLINMVDEHRESNIKLTIRFFNIEDGIIHATDKTEIEVDDEVNIIYLTIFLKIIKINICITTLIIVINNSKIIFIFQTHYSLLYIFRMSLKLSTKTGRQCYIQGCMIMMT